MERYQKCLSWLKASIEVVKPGRRRVKSHPNSRVQKPSAAPRSEALACQWGHGIGMSVRELPVISRAWSMEKPYKLKEDMAIALETYAGPKDPNFGIRIEEEVVVTAAGHKVITRFPVDELIDCPII